MVPTQKVIDLIEQYRDTEGWTDPVLVDILAQVIAELDKEDRFEEVLSDVAAIDRTIRASYKKGS